MLPGISSVCGFESYGCRLNRCGVQGVSGCTYVSVQICLYIESLLSFSALPLSWDLLLNWKLAFSSLLASHRALEPACSHAFMLVLQTCATMPGVLVDAENLNSGPRACTAGVLLAESSSQPLGCWIRSSRSDMDGFFLCPSSKAIVLELNPPQHFIQSSMVSIKHFKLINLITDTHFIVQYGSHRETFWSQ